MLPAARRSGGTLLRHAVSAPPCSTAILLKSATGRPTAILLRGASSGSSPTSEIQYAEEVNLSPAALAAMEDAALDLVEANTQTAAYWATVAAFCREAQKPSILGDEPAPAFAAPLPGMSRTPDFTNLKTISPRFVAAQMATVRFLKIDPKKIDGMSDQIFNEMRAKHGDINLSPFQVRMVMQYLSDKDEEALKAAEEIVKAADLDSKKIDGISDTLFHNLKAKLGEINLTPSQVRVVVQYLSEKDEEGLTAAQEVIKAAELESRNESTRRFKRIKVFVDNIARLNAVIAAGKTVSKVIDKIQQYLS